VNLYTKKVGSYRYYDDEAEFDIQKRMVDGVKEKWVVMKPKGNPDFYEHKLFPGRYYKP
jgi:hypothetical protein